MSLRIVNLQKDGDAKSEYILLKATADVNIKYYAIVDRTFDADGKVSDIHRHFFRFPSKIVKKDEYVALYTGKGNPRLGKTQSGATCHYYYWGSNAPFWNDKEVDQAELLEVKTIESRKK